MQKKQGIIRKALHAGGWQVFKRSARMLPFGGTFVVLALVGDDIRTKGVVRGVVNSGIDAIPFVGFTKNAVEMFTGDFIPDKPARTARK
ncbi:MAG: hypothetical protein ACRD6X_02970 [Pyrinomonadaceae bacterium]